MTIKAVIGLGNPGERYQLTRHNAGFLVVDGLVDRYGSDWRLREEMLLAQIDIDGHKLLVVKPQTFMNNSGRVVSYLTKQGIKPEEIIVVHDELDFPFGKVATKKGGSARGHNGVKSLIAAMGDNFYRVRCGVDRPTDQSQVPNYVLAQFGQPDSEISQMIDTAINEILKLLIP